MGKPGKMPPDRGIFRNWGCFLDFNDGFEIGGGLDICGETKSEEIGDEVEEEKANHLLSSSTKEYLPLDFSILFHTLLPMAYKT